MKLFLLLWLKEEGAGGILGRAGQGVAPRNQASGNCLGNLLICNGQSLSLFLPSASRNRGLPPPPGSPPSLLPFAPLHLGS